MASRQTTIDGNEAAARIAHRLSDVCAIYPITPASPEGELADAWSASGQTNLWGTVPHIVEMQSEAGPNGDPLYKDASGALAQHCNCSERRFQTLPVVVGGRCGLSSKEFTPGMIKAVFDELRNQEPRNAFTIGIHDDVSPRPRPASGCCCSRTPRPRKRCWNNRKKISWRGIITINNWRSYPGTQAPATLPLPERSVSHGRPCNRIPRAQTEQPPGTLLLAVDG